MVFIDPAQAKTDGLRPRLLTRVNVAGGDDAKT